SPDGVLLIRPGAAAPSSRPNTPLVVGRAGDRGATNRWRAQRGGVEPPRTTRARLLSIAHRCRTVSTPGPPASARWRALAGPNATDAHATIPGARAQWRARPHALHAPLY